MNDTYVKFMIINKLKILQVTKFKFFVNICFNPTWRVKAKYGGDHGHYEDYKVGHYEPDPVQDAGHDVRVEGLVANVHEKDVGGVAHGSHTEGVVLGLYCYVINLYCKFYEYNAVIN